MNLSERKNIILNILQKNPGMGKTAIMKAVYMLQQVKGIDLGYDFSIYTYGPYASDVMEDIDDLVSEGFLVSTMYPYQNYIGYKLNITDAGKHTLSQLNDSEQSSLEEILEFARGKTAKDLELYSTIIYVDYLYAKNSWGTDTESITKKVHEIKPHFPEEDILSAYNYLKGVKYLSS